MSKSKSVPFRLPEELHARFKGYCAIQRISMQFFLETVINATVEKNVPHKKILEAIKNIA